MASKIKRETDRRVIKTEAAIKEAFVKLASQKDFRKITISALAAEADIDRKTFYLHYPSIDALMQTLAREEARRMAADLKCATLCGEDGLDPAELMTEIKRAKDRLGSEDITGTRDIAPYVPIDELLAYLEKPLTEELLDICDAESETEETLLSYGVTFYVAGILATYKRWVHEQPEESLDEIAHYLKNGSICGSIRHVKTK